MSQSLTSKEYGTCGPCSLLTRVFDVQLRKTLAEEKFAYGCYCMVLQLPVDILSCISMCGIHTTVTTQMHSVQTDNLVHFRVCTHTQTRRLVYVYTTNHYFVNFVLPYSGTMAMISRSGVPTQAKKQ